MSDQHVMRLEISDVLGTDFKKSPLLSHIWQGFREEEFRRNTILLITRNGQIVTSISKLSKADGERP